MTVEESTWNSETIFRRIYYFIDRRGWSLSYLSKMARLSEATLCECRNKKGIPSTETLIKICDALGITMGEFFADENKPSDSYVVKEMKRLLNVQE